ncbi:MAG: HAD-IA family hydrolase [SAR202 cluster bacterium]|nr:HAD-IA family hydrolase [SAR202 cluster bacterium]
MEQLEFEPYLRKQMDELGVSSPEEALSALRVAIYSEMVEDPQVFRDNQWPHTVGLLRIAREAFCQTALVTMSQRPKALRVIRALDLESTLDLILTREDVKKPKPDPEIYLLAAKTFDVPPEECLVLEDSPTGARSAVAAGTNVVAVVTPFTAAGHQKEQVVPEAFMVTEPEKLLEVVQRRILEHNCTVHGYDAPESQGGA